jgi:hypothetical protein
MAQMATRRTARSWRLLYGLTGAQRSDALVDRTEDRPAVLVEHFDADAVSIIHERRAGSPGFDRLQTALLSDAAIAATAIEIGHRAGPDD